MTTPSSRLLSIGEFAAATQLSPKALRIYDEQRLLPPARIDTVTGYRYYSSDQVSLGRLVRTLREMNLSLTDIASVVASKDDGADAVLARLAQEIDSRYAREKRAYHAALVLLRKPSRADSPEIIQRSRPDTTVAVRPFMANRYDFVEKFRAEARAMNELLEHAGLVCRRRSFLRTHRSALRRRRPTRSRHSREDTGPHPSRHHAATIACGLLRDDHDQRPPSARIGAGRRARRTVRLVRPPRPSRDRSAARVDRHGRRRTAHRNRLGLRAGESCEVVMPSSQSPADHLRATRTARFAGPVRRTRGSGLRGQPSAHSGRAARRSRQGGRMGAELCRARAQSSRTANAAARRAAASPTR